MKSSRPLPPNPKPWKNRSSQCSKPNSSLPTSTWSPPWKKRRPCGSRKCANNFRATGRGGIRRRVKRDPPKTIALKKRSCRKRERGLSWGGSWMRPRLGGGRLRTKRRLSLGRWRIWRTRGNIKRSNPSCSLSGDRSTCRLIKRNRCHSRKKTRSSGRRSLRYWSSRRAWGWKLYRDSSSSPPRSLLIQARLKISLLGLRRVKTWEGPFMTTRVSQ